MDKLLVGLAIATLTLSGTSVWLWRERQDELLRIEQLQARITELEGAQKPAPLHHTSAGPAGTFEKIMPPLPERVAASASSVNVAPAPAVVPAPVANDQAMRDRMQESMDRQQKLLKDPEYRALMVAQNRMMLERAHRDLALLLGLSADQADQLLNILAEHQVQLSENSRTLFRGDQQGSQNYQRAAQALQNSRTAAIKELLGDSKFAEWQRYEQTSIARSTVTTLREALAGSDEPLRPEQVKPLIDALATEYRQPRDVRTPTAFSQPTDPQTQLRTFDELIETTAARHQRIRDAAAATLSSAQLTQFTKQLDQQLKVLQINAKLQRQRLESEPRNGTPQNSRSVNFVTSPGSLQAVEVVTGP